MNWVGNKSYYFEQLREFVPKDALSILEQTRQKVEASIDEQIEVFGRDLHGAVERAIADKEKELASSLEKAFSDLSAAVASLKDTSIDVGKITALKQQLDDYRDKWTGVGKQIGAAARKVISTATGINLPG